MVYLKTNTRYKVVYCQFSIRSTQPEACNCVSEGNGSSLTLGPSTGKSLLSCFTWTSVYILGERIIRQLHGTDLSLLCVSLV